MVRYTVLRLMLFFGFVCALWLVHVRGIWLVVLAAVLSMAASLLLLRGPREEFSSGVTRRLEERLERKQNQPATPGAPTDEEIEDEQYPDGRPGGTRS